jgi:hypothetical protein
MPNVLDTFGSLKKIVSNPFKPSAFSSPQKPIRGFMAGLDAHGNYLKDPPLLLQFMYNPTEMTDKKEVNFAVTNIPGLDRPFYTYSHGGERILEFTLLINSYEYGTERSTSFLNLPGMGGIKSELAKVQSFLYPYQNMDTIQKGKNIWGTVAATATNVVKQTAKGYWGTIKNYGNQGKNPHNPYPPQFTPPPKCLLTFGMELNECLIKTIDMRITMWNSVLDPVRAECKFTMAVDENSSRAAANYDMRRQMTRLGLLNVNPLQSLPTLPKFGRVG